MGLDPVENPAQVGQQVGHAALRGGETLLQSADYLAFQVDTAQHRQGGRERQPLRVRQGVRVDGPKPRLDVIDFLDHLVADWLEAEPVKLGGERGQVIHGLLERGRDLAEPGR